ncbi:MAG TPA: DUF6067 family protein [Kiritimatiellia bacterium]|nr:DUF6067 family protein [Kiritimatiellia bacterium]HPS07543.1 DUF6067 family protein [Kiritimatiellia bacterium]
MAMRGRLTDAVCLVLFVLAGARGLCAEDLADVPPPWEPVSVKQEQTSTDIGVWGRGHRFSGAGLPAAIRAAGKDVLAAPIRVVAESDGKPVAWQKGGHWVLESDAAHATVCGWLSADDVAVNTSMRIEYDGMARIGLTVVPRAKRAVRVGRLWLEIPLKRECVSLYHYYPGRWGGAANSGAVPAAGMSLPFKPFVWLGTEDRGLGWFTESDQGWQPESAERVIELQPQEGAMVLRVRLSDRELKLPATFTFGLQATPVKPWLSDFHEKRIWHASELGVGITMPVPKEWWVCHRAFPDRQPLRKLDRAQELGVKTVVFHEDWIPIQNYPVTNPETEFKGIVDACHQRGMQVLVYQGYELSPLAPEWAELHDEVLVKDAKGAYESCWIRPPDQRDYKVCYNSVWRDRLAEKIEWAMARYGFDGLYLDSTIMPAGCCNERHGCGYRAADGSLHPTYPVFAVRKLMQRLSRAVHARGGIISAHQSTCCVTPTLAFADTYWDGEQLTSGSHANEPLKALSLETFRAEFMGRNFGVPCEFLAYERPPQWTFDHALAVSMLHDVRVRPCGLMTLEKMAPIWDAMTRFDVSAADWHPYWEAQPAATAQPSSVKVSLYAHTATFWEKGRVLLVVANLSPDQAVTAQVAVSPARLGTKARTARDALSNARLSLAGGNIAVPLDPMRMRLVWIE